MPMAGSEQTPDTTQLDPASPALSSNTTLSGLTSGSGLSWNEVAEATMEDNMQDPANASNTAMDAPKLTPHKTHYMRDGMIQIRVEHTLFYVPRFGLSRDSTVFRALLQQYDQQSSGLPNSKDHMLHIQDEDVTSVDFARLLDLIYPSEFGKVPLETFEEWSSVLHLASKWEFHVLRSLAIDRLGALASPVDKVDLGRKYEISFWLKEAYVALCERTAPLTLEEGRRISLEDVIKISQARHNVRLYSSLVPAEAIQSTVDQLLSDSPHNDVFTSEVLPIPPPFLLSFTSEDEVSPKDLTTELLPDVVACQIDTSISQSPATLIADLPRVTRLVEEYRVHGRANTKACIIALISPHIQDQSTICSIIDIIVEEVFKYGGSSLPMTTLVDLCKALSNISASSLSWPSSSSVSESRTPDWQEWFASQLTKACYIATDNWSEFRPSNQNEKVIRASYMTRFMSELVEARIIDDDVFLPCWKKLLLTVDDSVETWARPLAAFFSENGRKPQTSSCCLPADEFFQGVQERIAELRAEGADQSSWHPKYQCFVDLQSIMKYRV